MLNPHINIIDHIFTPMSFKSKVSVKNVNL